MEEECLALARTMTGAAAEDTLLPALCEAAKTAVELRLRPGMTAEDCGQLFSCAAALLATADWRQARQEDAMSFRAGDVSVTGASAAERREDAETLRALAWRLMTPYTLSGGFSFQGVRA